MTIKVGDIVEILSNGQQYTTYTKWAVDKGMTKYSESPVPLGTKVKVVAADKHYDYPTDSLVGVELADGTQRIYNVKGVKKAGLDLSNPVFTIEGTPVTIVTTEGRDPKYPVLGYEGSAVILSKFTKDGKNKNGVERRNLTNTANAVEEPLYVNLYDDEEGEYVGYNLYSTAENAFNTAKSQGLKPVGVGKIVIVKGRAPIRQPKEKK